MVEHNQPIAVDFYITQCSASVFCALLSMSLALSDVECVCGFSVRNVVSATGELQRFSRSYCL